MINQRQSTYPDREPVQTSRATSDGGDGNDVIKLRGSIAVLDGGVGDDRLDGGASGDKLDGGDDSDVLNGHAGQDMLTGGAGGDLFVLSSAKDSKVGEAKHDIITDFSHAEGDRIDLSRIDADTTQVGDQAFRLVASGAFTHNPGELIQTSDGKGHTLLQGDVNGDGTADFLIALTGAPTLAPADFVL